MSHIIVSPQCMLYNVYTVRENIWYKSQYFSTTCTQRWVNQNSHLCVLKKHISTHAYVWAGLFAAFVTLQKEVINLLGATIEDILTIAMCCNRLHGYSDTIVIVWVLLQ